MAWLALGRRTSWVRCRASATRTWGGMRSGRVTGSKPSPPSSAANTPAYVTVLTTAKLLIKQGGKAAGCQAPSLFPDRGSLHATWCAGAYACRGCAAQPDGRRQGHQHHATCQRHTRARQDAQVRPLKHLACHHVLTQPSRYEAGWILVCWLTFVCDGVTWQLADPGGVQRGGGGTAEPLARGALQVGHITRRA